MDSNRIKGTHKEFKGSIKEVARKVAGNHQTKVEGRIEKTTGKVRHNIGEEKDEPREWLRHEK